VASSKSAEWLACEYAETSERRFWAAEWASLESEIQTLRLLADPKNATTKKEEHHVKKSPLADLKNINLEPKSTADLAPALVLLKGLYEDGKERIGKLNAREQKLKEQFEEKKLQHERRLQAIDDRFKNHTLSEEFHTNETRDENRLFSYWERVRERQHKQYHTSLKIQHSTLDKMKTMIDLYEKTISGKADRGSIEKQLRKMTGMPATIVFLQGEGVKTAQACDELLQELDLAQQESQEPVSRGEASI